VKIQRIGSFNIPDGSLELIKWIGLTLMTLDHVNKYIFREAYDWMYLAGRVVMPLFALVLGYQLARPGLLVSRAFTRMSFRLAFFGMLASVPYIGLGAHVGAIYGGWWPLNILFTLLLSATCIKLLDKNGRWDVTLAILVFTGLGWAVEFFWPAVALTVCAWAFFRSGSLVALAAAATSLFLVGVLVNHSQAGFFAIPLLILATRINVQIPRARNFFYSYYPGHLFLIWLVLGCC